jgi:diguanylate cyclase (GGDEF)-like protein/PAS domain S-box-containing protein
MYAADETRRPLVLVVDDDPAMRYLAKATLEQEGCVVQDAESGSAALSLLNHIEPDLILLDVIMPEIDGFTFCEKLRAMPDKQRVPVLMMTGLEDTDSIRRAYHVGASDFITKPINWLILGHHVRYILRASKTLEELIKSESRNAALLNAMPDSMLRVSQDGTVLECRGSSDAMLPLSWAGAKGDKVYELMPAQTAGQIMHYVREVLRTGEMHVFECEQYVKDMPCQWEARIVRSGEYETLVILRNITERKLTEKALKESEERYALASLAANDGLWDWDMKSDEVHYSGRWKAMLGYEEDEIGQGTEEWFKRIHPADTEQVKLEISKHLEGTSATFENEHRMMHKNGSYRWMLTRGIAVREDDGTPVRMAGSQTDISLRKRAEEQLVRDAFYDVLTGLPNRGLFMDRLGHALKRLKRLMDGYGFAVLFLDLDRFKVINDSLGHMTGDALLIETAKRLEKCVRPGDTVARLGGDEFVVLFDDVRDAESARAIAERVQSSLSTPFYVNACEIFSSASIGIALSSQDYDRPEDILRDADITMYRAKALGKARVEVFDPSMRAHAVSLLHMETDLRRALEHDEFRVYYQPIVALGTDAIMSLEALIRWQHPHQGLVSPAEFIPLAEETGLIVAVGEWVMRKVCADIKEWQADGSPPIRVAVNISPVQLRRPGFVKTVVRILEETRVGGDCLGMEITENVLLDKSTATIEILNELKGLGIHIILDDFGTGYSSLSYLQHLPIDILKIDRSFVAKLTRDDEQAKIIETIILLGRNLGIDVVAEGIETDEQLERLKSIHCDQGQGFLFSRPIEGERVRAMIHTRNPENPDRAVGNGRLPLEYVR